MDTPRPCVICRKRCGLLFDGLPVHIPCFWGSTAAERAAASGEPGAPIAPPAGGADLEHDSEPGRSGSPGTPAPAPAAQPPAAPAQAFPPSLAAGSAVARPAATGRARFYGPAVVLDVDVVGLPDGSSVPHPFPTTSWSAVADLTGHYQLGVQVNNRYAEAGQVWVTEAMLAQLGYSMRGLSPQPKARLEEFRDATRGGQPLLEALAHGWTFGGEGEPSLGRWTWMRRGGEKALIALIPLMLSPGEWARPQDIAKTAYPVLAGSPDPGELARRLASFAAGYRYPLKISPQTSAFDYLRTLKWGEHEAILAPSPVLDLGGAEAELDGNWSRRPLEHEAAMRYVHAYDRGGSYLAGMSGGLQIGVGRPVHVPGHLDVTAKTFGLHQVADLPPAGDVRLPHPLLPDLGRRPSGPFWRHSLSIAWAIEQGYRPQILQSWLWPDTEPVFTTWYERVRDARSAFMADPADVDQAANLAQLKQIYVRMVGQMNAADSRGQTGFAPERRWAILARARINLHRQMVTIGKTADVWPLAWDNDTVVYASDNPDPRDAWPGDPGKYGRRIGDLRWEGSALMADHAHHLTGHQWLGKADLTKNWNP